MGDLAYPLVSDLKREISSKYYVLTRDGVALRGLFIIDKEVRDGLCKQLRHQLASCCRGGRSAGWRAQGVIQHATINNLSFGRSVEETIRILQAVQYVQENPDEVCPAGWQPGSKSMSPTPAKSKEYFAAL